MHISHNWGTIQEFTDVGFGAMRKQPPSKAKLKLYEQMLENSSFIRPRHVRIGRNNA